MFRLGEGRVWRVGSSFSLVEAASSEKDLDCGKLSYVALLLKFKKSAAVAMSGKMDAKALTACSCARKVVEQFLDDEQDAGLKSRLEEWMQTAPVSEATAVMNATWTEGCKAVKAKWEKQLSAAMEGCRKVATGNDWSTSLQPNAAMGQVVERAKKTILNPQFASELRLKLGALNKEHS